MVQKASTLVLASSMEGLILGIREASWSRTCSQQAATVAALGWAKMVRISKATMSVWFSGPWRAGCGRNGTFADVRRTARANQTQQRARRSRIGRRRSVPICSNVTSPRSQTDHGKRPTVIDLYSRRLLGAATVLHPGCDTIRVAVATAGIRYPVSGDAKPGRVRSGL